MIAVDPALEAPQAAAADAVTLSWADPARGLFGIARLGLAEGRASGLGVLFHGRDIAAAGAATVDAGAGAPAGVVAVVEEPLSSWTVGVADAFTLRVSALGPAAALASDDPVAQAGGMVGYEQPVAVRGHAWVDGDAVEVQGLGQRGHAWGDPDWDRIVLTRSVSAWFGDDLAVSLAAVRGRRAKGHGDEAVSAVVFGPDGPQRMLEPRLSTTSDGEGRQRRAGIELFADAESLPLRASGSVLCGTSLDLGRMRLDTSFFAWTLDDRAGVGRYDVLRRAS